MAVDIGMGFSGFETVDTGSMGFPRTLYGFGSHTALRLRVDGERAR